MFSSEHAHLTSQEVFRKIRQRLPAVNQSTVYRSLARLADQGKVSISDMGTGSAVYELLTDGLHHHLVCQECGMVTTLAHEEVGHFFKDLEKKSKFQITTNHLVLFGVCPQCRNDPNPERGSTPQA